MNEDVVNLSEGSGRTHGRSRPRWLLKGEKGLTGTRLYRQRTEHTQRRKTGKRGTCVGNTWLESEGSGTSACGIGLCRGRWS